MTGDVAPLAVSGLAVTDALAAPVRDEDRPVIKFLQKLVDIYVGGYHRVQIASPCVIPPTGPAILVCNHVSSLDPVLLQWGCPRLISWMMAREYYVPGTRWFFDIINTIPVERSRRDITATRAAMRALDKGQVLGIFPEGRLARDRNIGHFQTGVAMLGLKSGVSVYPASLDGTMRSYGMFDACFISQHARIAYGPRIPLHTGDLSRQALENATAEIHRAVEKMHALVR